MSEAGREINSGWKIKRRNLQCSVVLERFLGYLHGDQPVVDSPFFHQLAVRPQLHNFTITESGNNVGIPDGGEAVSDHDGGATQPDLDAIKATKKKKKGKNFFSFFEP